MDEIDRQILDHLATDGRISMSSLAKLVGMTAPSVSERVRQMEENGVIKGFTVEIDNRKLGFILEALVRIRPLPGQMHIVQKMIVDEKRFSACDKVTGEDCFIARLNVKSVEELDTILEPLLDKAATNTAVIKSSPISNRQPR